VYPPLDDPTYPFYAGAGHRNPWRHVREFTIGEIEKLLQQAGFARMALITVSASSAGRDGPSFRGHVATRIIRTMAHVIPAAGTTILGTAWG
jgi:hypothetical protein